MKRKTIAVFGIIILATSVLSGCNGIFNPEIIEPDTEMDTEEESDTEEDFSELTSAETDITQSYLDFLNGQTSVQTAPIFGMDDDSNLDDVPFGTYSYSDLKATVSESEYSDFTTEYAFVDLNADGQEEMVLKFRNVDPSFLNWTGVITMTDNGLTLTYSYIDGYRTDSVLYDSGYFIMCGSSGASSSTQYVVGFDEECSGYNVFTQNYFFGPSATGIVYDLNTTDTALEDYYSQLENTSLLEVSELVTDDSIKISATSYSEDANVRSVEEAMLQDLVSRGAELISDEEMTELSSTDAYISEEVIFTEFVDDADDAASAGGNQSSSDIPFTIGYADATELSIYDSYYEFEADTSEYATDVLISADCAVGPVDVVALEFESSNDDGDIFFNSEVLYTRPELNPDKPLVLKMQFMGDIPNMGISYQDADGTLHTYAISMSGMDSSLLLTEVYVN